MPEKTNAKPPKARFDGGSLDCGSGLLLLIRKHIDPLEPGEILEFTSTESSVEVDLPSWCNLTGNPYLSCERDGEIRRFLLQKGGEAKPAAIRSAIQPSSQSPFVAPMLRRPFVPVPAAAVCGVGSWPRPKWMLRAIHERLLGKISEEEFEDTAQDAVRMACDAQIRAGVSMLTDGEQRRDSYASFIGRSIENCQLIPLLDVLPYVDDPEEFKKELQALDIPAGEVRHPMVFGPLKRAQPLVADEANFLQSISSGLATKIALPGPYLLTRMMWMDCVVDRAYANREALAADVVQILRDEVAGLLQQGISVVQIDEPILTEVVFGVARNRRSFMCGILGEKKNIESELRFAAELLTAVLEGLPEQRLALHVCRGNWSPDESHALHGSYEPLIDIFNQIPVGMLLLEMATERAGALEILKSIRSDRRIGVGVANQKRPDEPLSVVQERVSRAISLFGRERLLFHPDCGFATFADNPIDSEEQAESILKRISGAVAAVA